MNTLRYIILLFMLAVVAGAQTKKISELTELAEAPAVDDYLALWDTSALITKKILPSNLFLGFQPALPAARVPFGDGAGVQTSEAAFTYDTSLNILSVGGIISPGQFGFTPGGSGSFVFSDLVDSEDLVLNLAGTTAAWSSTTGIGLFDMGLIDIDVPTEAYDATGWNGDNTVPTKDAVRDKFEAIGRAGLTQSGTQLAPTTTPPLAPTCSTLDYVLWYDGPGEIDLPAVATYSGATILIYTAALGDVTVDPNLSEIIVEDGVSLGAGTADVITATVGLLTAYHCDGARWIKLEGGGGGVASLTPWTENIDGATFDLTTTGDITASNLIGGGLGITSLSAAGLSGTVPALIHETITTSDSNIITPIAGVSNIVVTTDGETTITLDAATETLTFSATPTTGSYFRATLEGHTVDCVVTIPSTYSFGTRASRTTFTAPANRPTSLVFRRDAGRYVMWGDPVGIADLPADTTPAISAKIEIDQGSGGEYATAANLRDLLGTTFNGTAASPNTDNPETVAFDASTFYHFSGATQELDLPAAAGYVGRGIVVRFDGSYVVTCDPNGSEVIDLDGTAMATGEALIITGTAGQIGVIVSDGTSWATSGGSAAYTQETP